MNNQYGFNKYNYNYNYKTLNSYITHNFTESVAVEALKPEDDLH